MSDQPNVRKLKLLARASLPTRAGQFDILSFADPCGFALDDVAVVRAGQELLGREQVPVRVHSECVTGDAFGSVRCDCGDQLEMALERLTTGELTVLVYLRQEGRGIGIANKVRAYELQDQGLDTVQANLRLGFAQDGRRYDVAASILHTLGVRSVRLHTNNPDKVRGLKDFGIETAKRIPIIALPRSENRSYLTTKLEKLDHML